MRERAREGRRGHSDKAVVRGHVEEAVPAQPPAVVSSAATETEKRGTHLSRLWSSWTSCDVSSRDFSVASPSASCARSSLARLPPTRARVRSTPSSYPSPLTPHWSSCAYVLRTWNESTSSPSERATAEWVLSGVLTADVELRGEVTGER